MEIDKLIETQTRFSPKFTDTERKECYDYIKGLLESHQEVINLLERGATGIAYYDREFSDYRLMVEYMEATGPASNPIIRAVSYVVK